ncbi:MAG: Hpt domain-containing protein [Saprospiraceae bacterium]|nr:Hpt domain-containing protein [Saprospiraceae bacterium]
MIADLRYLNSLMGYDATRTQKFIEVYKTEIPKLMECLLAEIKLGNHTQVRTLAHSVKGQSAYIMAEAVVRIAQEIEQDARNEVAIDLIEPKARDLHTAVRRVLQML